MMFVRTYALAAAMALGCALAACGDEQTAPEIPFSADLGGGAAQDGAGNSGGTPDAGSASAAQASCPSGQQRCGDACVDVKSDPHNCGLCGRECPLGVCQDGKCPTECAYDDADVCGGDQTKWCANGYCKPCADGKLNCDSTGGCECETGCDGDKCADPTCDRNSAYSCGNDPTKWCYHKDNAPVGECKTCSSGSTYVNYNCDGLMGCECQVKKEYQTGNILGHCDGAQCVKE